MHDELYRAHREIPQMMPFVHLPVQSGSDAVLKAMNRKHNRDDYFRIIDKLQECHAELALSSDFIIGFPGESDQDFADTLDLIERVGFTSAYSFTYSKRPGTPGASMQGQIHDSIKATRLQQVQALLNKQQTAFNEKFIGRTVPILFERAGKKDGQIMGRSPHMHSVFVMVESNLVPQLIGQIRDVHITGGYANSLAGVLV
jgi:tRNA-2-methylthio-N6-dimethylallyladenosine synthase